MMEAPILQDRFVTNTQLNIKILLSFTKKMQELIKHVTQVSKRLPLIGLPL